MKTSLWCNLVGQALLIQLHTYIQTCQHTTVHALHKHTYTHLLPNASTYSVPSLVWVCHHRYFFWSLQLKQGDTHCHTLHRQHIQQWLHGIVHRWKSTGKRCSNQGSLATHQQALTHNWSVLPYNVRKYMLHGAMYWHHTSTCRQRPYQILTSRLYECESIVTTLGRALWDEC